MTVEELEQLIMPFGQYRRKRVVDLPMKYAAWLLANVRLESPLKDAVELALQRRREEFAKWAAEKSQQLAEGRKLRWQTMKKLLQDVPPATETLQ